MFELLTYRSCETIDMHCFKMLFVVICCGAKRKTKKPSVESSNHSDLTYPREFGPAHHYSNWALIVVSE